MCDVARIVACAVVLGALATTGTVGLAANRSATVVNRVVFEDATVEEPAGPDITTIAVSSDGRWLSFRVYVPTNPAVTPDLRMRIWLDVDDSRETGLYPEGVAEPTGYDHFLLLDPLDVSLYGLPLAGLFWCEGSICSRRATPLLSYQGGPTFTIDTSLLDPALGLRRFERVRFYVTATSGIRFVPGSGYDFTEARLDVAPDEGEWTFDTRVLRVASFRATPAEPRAGSPFSLRLRVLRTDTGTVAAQGQLTCSLTLAGTRIPARVRRLAGSGAVCTFDVPAGMSGRRFRATIGVAARGDAISRSVSGQVR